jgi:hypothetical protein
MVICGCHAERSEASLAPRTSWFANVEISLGPRDPPRETAGSSLSPCDPWHIPPMAGYAIAGLSAPEPAFGVRFGFGTTTSPGTPPSGSDVPLRASGAQNDNHLRSPI